MEHVIQGGKLLHGGDYNPEQWLEYPNVLEEDIRLMKKAKVNCVSVGIFSWSMLEPEEGVYDLDWLEDIMNRLYESGISVILATPSGGMPHWLTAKYPEVMQVQENEQRNLPGKRQNFCYTSPLMKEKIQKMDQELSRRFGTHPAVILWHISNELGGNFGDSTCHCELCQTEFREWLKKKYKTLDALNQAWWNRFWSHVYTDWNQIHSPAPHGEGLAHGLKLDWKRFSTEQITKFCTLEAEAVRKYSNRPVTTNFMDFFKGLNYHHLQTCLDIISWDSYPFWHETKDEVPVAVCAAANHSIMRSMKKQPFLLMESTPSCINWRNHNPVKRPGMHMLSSMQAIAHGSNSVQYFQWRKGRGAYEKFHGAVVDHKNGADTRTFREVTEVGTRLEYLSDIVSGTVNQPKVAMIFDWDNWWSLEDLSGPRLDLDYVSVILQHYQAFWEAGIDVDFLPMSGDLSGYQLVVAPENYMYTKGYAQKVEAFVAKGGTYVTTYFSGMVDDTDLCFIGQHPLEEVLGIIQEEIDAPSRDYCNFTTYQGKRFELGKLREVVRPMDATEVLAVYEEDYCAGMPVVTRHSYQEGTSYYLAAETNIEFLRIFYQKICEELGIKNPLGITLPYGVTVATRIQQKEAEGKSKQEEIVFVMNFLHEPVIIKDIGSWIDADTKETYKGVLNLPKFSCKLLKKQ